MQVGKKQLEQAADKGIISPEQVDELCVFLQEQHNQVAHFSLTHVLYYLGGLIAIAAMTLFMSLSWETFGGTGILIICMVYALIATFVMKRLARNQLIIPAGICATFIVCLSPLAVFGLLHSIDLWPNEQSYWQPFGMRNWQWLSMELATLLAGIAMVSRVKFPFILMPVAVAFWFSGNELLSVLTNGDDIHFSAVNSIYTGIAMVIIAFTLDLRIRQSLDYAFWFYIFGVIAFWLGVSWQYTDAQWTMFGYFCINIIMIFMGLALTRRVFVVCGALGTFYYLGFLALSLFEDSWFFPFVLTAIGAGVVYLGIYWQKHEQRLTTAVRAQLPSRIRELLDRES